MNFEHFLELEQLVPTVCVSILMFAAGYHWIAVIRSRKNLKNSTKPPERSKMFKLIFGAPKPIFGFHYGLNSRLTSDYSSKVRKVWIISITISTLVFLLGIIILKIFWFFATTIWNNLIYNFKHMIGNFVAPYWIFLKNLLLRRQQIIYPSTPCPSSCRKMVLSAETRTNSDLDIARSK